jgi:hypothetical protein
MAFERGTLAELALTTLELDWFSLGCVTLGSQGKYSKQFC